MLLCYLRKEIPHPSVMLADIKTFVKEKEPKFAFKNLGSKTLTSLARCV